MTTDNVGKDKLRAYAERVSRLTDEKAAIASDITDILAEMTAEGYSKKAFNAALKRHRMTGEEREQADLFDMEVHTYISAMDGGEE